MDKSVFFCPTDCKNHIFQDTLVNNKNKWKPRRNKKYLAEIIFPKNNI